MSAREISQEKRFLVAFSFAGEQRELVRAIAEAVENRLGQGTVFFDEWFEHYIAGDDADLRLQSIYEKQSILVVPCVSERYGGKSWTRAEHKAIRSLQMQLYASTDEKDSFRILPIRVGKGDVAGVFENTICPEVQHRSAVETSELIINRLRLIVPTAGRVTNGPGETNPQRFVYLAECTPDLEDPTKPINRNRMKAFLEELGWTVLPGTEYPVDQYRSLLENDLQQCLAFVQLLGPYPWKRGGFDRIQNEAAVATEPKIKRFRYRSSEIELTQVEAIHREFLQAPDVIAAGFEDFKVHLKTELTVLAQRRQRDPEDDASAENAPLVRVVVRSPNADVLWDKVFQWIYEQEKILPEQLGPGETFEAKQSGEPCHGFMVVCDEAALEDGPHSTRADMQQCRLIQMKEKEASRRPPVALVYWPPPSPAWSRLQRCTPVKLHRILGDAPANLNEFFAEVRRVAK